MNYQIQIQFTGTYQLDSTTTCVNPLVIAYSGADDFIDSVNLTCLFNSSTYSYIRDIGSFNYIDEWTNQDVIDYITNYMNSIQIN
jgi:hypothetical protein